MFDNRTAQKKIRKSSLIYDLIIDFDSLSRSFAAAPFFLPFCTHLNFDYFIFLIFYYFSLLSFHRCLFHPPRCSAHFKRPLLMLAIRTRQRNKRQCCQHQRSEVDSVASHGINMTRSIRNTWKLVKFRFFPLSGSFSLSSSTRHVHVIFFAKRR